MQRHGGRYARMGLLVPRLLVRFGPSGMFRVTIAATHELMKSKGHFIGMGRTPGDDAFQFQGVVGEGADFHELVFDRYGVAHIDSRMTHFRSA